ncbi:MAG: SurA N-terminal domain-containing protein [bacterium]|nr:SurA N-terminal domain-containing protein [bacterium]MDW8164641.1 SurA N-terminal domain-containing protein [Candidatus Omnitrophota bacterium]
MAFKFLRKKKNVRIILWIITILIIPGFFLWGVGLEKRSGPNYVAVINRQPILWKEFYNQLWKIEKQYREIFGENYEKIKDQMNIEKIVLENMIREKLLLQEAKRRGIKVFKNEIINVMKQDPVFKNEKGEFDEEKYSQIISNYPDEELAKIEEQIKKEILIQKLKEQVISETNIDVNEKEIEDYLKYAQSTKIDKEDVRKMILWQKRENFFEDWYKNLREKSKVIIYLPSKTNQENKQTMQ